MIAPLVAALGLLQVGGAAPEPIRVWRADSIAYVALRDPGHVLVLHVDAIGRIQVLYPLTPEDQTPVSSDRPIALELPPTAQANPATFVAIRSRWPLEFASLRWGSWWDYQNALLLQPTAGDPLAALLEIADRVTDGRAYEYASVMYLRNGTTVSRRDPLQPDVCLSCVRRGTSIAAVALPPAAVDCSNASLTNAFCGIANGAVTITSAPTQVYQAPPASAPAPVSVEYIVPVGFHRVREPRFQRPPPPQPPAARPSQGVASPIVPRLVVPSRATIRTFGARP